MSVSLLVCQSLFFLLLLLPTWHFLLAPLRSRAIQPCHTSIPQSSDIRRNPATGLTPSKGNAFNPQRFCCPDCGLTVAIRSKSLSELSSASGKPKSDSILPHKTNLFPDTIFLMCSGMERRNFSSSAWGPTPTAHTFSKSIRSFASTWGGAWKFASIACCNNPLIWQVRSLGVPHDVQMILVQKEFQTCTLQSQILQEPRYQ